MNTIIFACAFLGLNFQIERCMALNPPGSDGFSCNSLNRTVVKLQQRIAALESQQPPKQQIAFSTALTKDLQLGRTQTVEYDKIITNVGNTYDPRHGHFTAPVKGLYQFSVTAMAAPGQKLHLQLVKNGAEVARVHAYDHYLTGSNTANLLLEVGDMVWVRHMSGYGSEDLLGSLYSTFNGFLIA